MNVQHVWRRALLHDDDLSSLYLWLDVWMNKQKQNHTRDHDQLAGHVLILFHTYMDYTHTCYSIRPKKNVILEIFEQVIKKVKWP
jgi:hypothetical protein